MSYFHNLEEEQVKHPWTRESLGNEVMDTAGKTLSHGQIGRENNLLFYYNVLRNKRQKMLKMYSSPRMW